MSHFVEPRTPRSRTAWRRVARRRTTSLADFVSALRLAIAAFGQGELGSVPDLTARELAELGPFLAAALAASVPGADRIVYAGDLSPDSGVTDLLACACAWAERHPERRLELCWAGSGDLLGVLRAQWIPGNLVQTFRSTIEPGDPAAVLALFDGSVLLAAPNLGAVELATLARAMAAGLPVLGTVRSVQVRRLVTASSGWLFDPLAPESLAAALDAALATPPAALDEMRQAARRAILALGEPRGDGASQWRWETDLLPTSEPA